MCQITCGKTYTYLAQKCNSANTDDFVSCDSEWTAPSNIHLRLEKKQPKLRSHVKLEHNNSHDL